MGLIHEENVCGREEAGEFRRRIAALEQELDELRDANEILQAVARYFSGELPDTPDKHNTPDEHDDQDGRR